MEELKYIIPVGTLIIGWLLNEVSQSLRTRATDRRAIARALSDLLEIRHQTFGLKAAFDEFGKRFNLPNNFQLILLNYFDNILPSADDLRKKYNETVDAVASADPILGFRLRSKDILNPLLRTLRNLASADPSASNLWPQLEAQLMQLVKSPLDEIIVELAQVHGWRTKLRVRRLLKRPLIEPKEMEEYLANFGSLIKGGQPMK